MRETLTIKLVRHGSKNNDPSAHGTGIEALLNPLKIKDIVAFAARELQQLPQCGAVEVKSTPVPRALETARLVSQIFALDPEVRVRLGSLAVDELIGSMAQSADGKLRNLSPRRMSEIWAEAKTQDSSAADESERASLRAWCQLGFDCTCGESGISLREIACRLGRFVEQTIRQHEAGTGAAYSLAFGHSGDLEPFLYLLLQMSGCTEFTLAEACDRIAPAFKPLEGIVFRLQSNGTLFLDYPSTEGAAGARIDRQVLHEQSAWLEKHAISGQVLKLKAEGALL